MHGPLGRDLTTRSPTRNFACFVKLGPTPSLMSFVALFFSNQLFKELTESLEAEMSLSFSPLDV